jgi:hypothetical protein
MLNIKKIIGIAIIIIIAFSFGTHWYLEGRYIYTRPDKPQPELDRTCPFTLGGKTVYITQQESFQLDLLIYITIIVAVLGVIYEHYFDPFNLYKKNKF